VQANVYLTQGTIVEQDVFVGPGVRTTNDDTMARHDGSYELRGATLRRACRIGGGAILLPGIEIGEGAFVGAGAVVTRDVPPARSSSACRHAIWASSAMRRCSSAGASVGWPRLRRYAP